MIEFENNQGTPAAGTSGGLPAGGCSHARRPVAERTAAHRQVNGREKAVPISCRAGSGIGGSHRWWDGLGLESERLERLVPGLEVILARGVADGRAKYGASGTGRNALAYRVRVYAVLYTAVRAEGVLRNARGVRGRTHDAIAAGMTEHAGEDVPASRSVSWLRGSSKCGIRAHDLLALIASESLSPPVRRWLAEQLGAEMGFSVAFDLGVVGPTGRARDTLEGHCVDIMSAAGYLAAGVRDALDDGRLDADERDALRGRVRGVMAELAALEAGLG